MNREDLSPLHTAGQFPAAGLRPGGRTGLLVLLCALLVILTVSVYLPVEKHRFLNLDDNAYVTENAHVASGITAENVVWAFTTFYAANWHPVTWLSHMTDVRLFGMDSRGHHLVNVFIHTLSALLLLTVLIRSTGAVWHSFFTAALFALHPLHVESVAWVAERKDVLSACFWFMSLLAYSGYAARSSAALYRVSLLFFVLGLMSKPMLVTLPLIMLLMDFWPLARFRTGERSGRLTTALSLIQEKIPFLACSLLSCLITFAAQQRGGAVHGFAEIPFTLRLENALIAYVTYIGRTLWPTDLAVLYPFKMSLPLWQAAGSFGILALVSAAAYRARHRCPYLLFGWSWFIITLLPVIGIIQVGAQSLADRYAYLPVTGLFICVVWGGAELANGVKYRRAVALLCAAAAVIAAAAATRHQLGYWQDSVTLFRRTLQVTSGNSTINYNLGLALQAQGDLDGAIREYREALRISPDHIGSHNNLGLALARKGDPDGAVQQYRLALRLDPDNAEAHYNLGLVYSRRGDLHGAIREYRETVRIRPRDTHARNNLGGALALSGDLDGAINEYREALRIDPTDRNAQTNLDIARAQKSMRDKP